MSKGVCMLTFMHSGELCWMLMIGVPHWDHGMLMFLRNAFDSSKDGCRKCNVCRGNPQNVVGSTCGTCSGIVLVLFLHSLCFGIFCMECIWY